MADTELRLVEKAVMDVVLSREGRRRYSKGDPLTLDPSDLRDIVRLTMAKCATSPSHSTAPEATARITGAVAEVGERAAFELHERRSNLRRVGEGQYENPCVESAWEGWQARAALASRPAEVGDNIPRASNDALNAMAKYWKLDGDWMTCKGCRRSLIASRDGEELAHGDGCKYWDQQHPWAQLRELIARRRAPAGVAQ